MVPTQRLYQATRAIHIRLLCSSRSLFVKITQVIEKFVPLPHKISTIILKHSRFFLGNSSSDNVSEVEAGQTQVLIRGIGALPLSVCYSIRFQYVLLPLQNVGLNRFKTAFLIIHVAWQPPSGVVPSRPWQL